MCSHVSVVSSDSWVLFVERGRLPLMGSTKLDDSPRLQAPFSRAPMIAGRVPALPSPILRPKTVVSFSALTLRHGSPRYVIHALNSVLLPFLCNPFPHFYHALFPPRPLFLSEFYVGRVPSSIVSLQVLN